MGEEEDCKNGCGEKVEELFYLGTNGFHVENVDIVELDDGNDGFGDFEAPIHDNAFALETNGGEEGGGGEEISSSSISDPFNSSTFAKEDNADDVTMTAVVAKEEGQEKDGGGDDSPVDDFDAPNETITNTSNHSTDENKDILSSVFDGLIDVQDAPLPPLVYSFYSAAVSGGDGVDVGGDEVIMGTTSSSKLEEDYGIDDANAIIDSNEDGGFGNFEAIATTMADGVSGLDDGSTPAAFFPVHAGDRDFLEEKKTNSDDDDKQERHVRRFCRRYNGW